MKKAIRFKNNAFVVIAAIACVILTSCVKEIDRNTGEGYGGGGNSFDFSTKKSVEFTLKYDVPTGYRLHFELFSTSPLTLDAYKSYVKDSTLIPFLSGRSDENGEISFKGELPSSVSEIYAYSTAIGVPVLMKALVRDGVVSDFKIAEVTAKNVAANFTRAAVSGTSGTNSWTTYNVSLHKPSLPAVSMIISQEDKNLIDKSFQENQDYDKVRSYYRPCIQLNEKANVKIYSVKNGANSNRTNALAYFVYQNENIKPEDINSKLELVFPKLNKTIPAEGAGYQLLYNGEKTFEAGSRIGFALFPDIDPNNIATTNAQVLYSYFNIGSWNTYTYPGIGGNQTGLAKASVPHMVMSLLRKDKDGHAIIAIGFEDQPYSTSYGTNKGNFRDDLFIVEVDPAASLPEDLPHPPTDEPTYDTEFISSGILCFEDCWPHVGDYDINDVTIAYERALCYSYTVGMVGMKEKFTFLHNGATFTNGFGYQLLGVKQSDITKCTVLSEYKCEGQGLDATSSSEEAIVMLFDNGKVIKTGTTFSVDTYFSVGTMMLGVNPFIVVNNYNNTSGNILSKDRIEVHLPTITRNLATNFLPTSKANTTYWGKYDDKSDPKKKIYYVRSGNYPFALDINWDNSKHGAATGFVVPKEAKSIDYTYPDFNKWVDSKGKTNTDWYLHPNAAL